MAIMASDQVTLAIVTELQNRVQYFKVQQSTLGAPSAPATTSPTGGWSTVEPGYNAGDTTTLYTVELNIFTDGSFDYLPVQKSSSYEAAKQAWNKAEATRLAQAAADADRALRDAQFGYKYKVDINVTGDPDKYYPVLINGGNQSVKRDILVNRGYSERHPAEWNPTLPTHGGGLTLKIKTNFGGWGGANYSWEIHELEEMYNPTFAGAGNEISNMGFYILLRGGGPSGAPYHIYSDQPVEGDHYIGGSFPAAFYEDTPPIVYVSGANTYTWDPKTKIRTSVDTEAIRTRKFIALAQDTAATAIKASVNEYAVNSSETVAPTTGWSEATPTRTAGTFIWFRTKITRGDNTTTTTNPALLTGNAGATGAAGTPASTVTLTSTTQALVSPPAGGATSPATAVVTGTTLNATINKWEYSVNGAAFTTTAPTGAARSGNVVTITGSTMTADTITVKMSDTGTSAADTMTVAKVKNGATGSSGSNGSNGADGADAYTVLLSNESHTFPGTATAAVPGAITSTVIAYKGGTRIAANITGVTGAVSGLTTTIVSNNTTSAGVTLTALSSPALTTKNGIVTLSITVDSTKTFTKDLSWSVAFTGATGANGTNGTNGSTGAAGKGIVSVTPYFKIQLTSAGKPSDPGINASGWGTTEPAYAASSTLWRCEKILYTDSSVAYTEVTEVASFSVAASAIVSANGKNSRYTSTSLPASATTNPDTGQPFVVGDTWWQVDNMTDRNAIGQWVYKGPSQWTAEKIKSEVIANLDVQKLTAGAGNMEFLTAEKLVTQFSYHKVLTAGAIAVIPEDGGLYKDPMFGNDMLSKQRADNSPNIAYNPVSQSMSGTGNLWLTHLGENEGKTIPLAKGSLYTLRVFGTGLTSANTRTFYITDSNGSSYLSTGSVQYGAGYMQASFTIGGDNARIQVYKISGSSSMTITRVEIRQGIGGTLIEGGSITNDKIDTNSVFANMKITSPLIQTVDTASRGIKIDGPANALYAYNSSGLEIFKLDGTSGIIRGSLFETDSGSTTGIKIDGRGGTNSLVAYGSGSTKLIEINGNTGTITGVNIQAVNISGSSTITGGLIQTSDNGSRIALENDKMRAYYSNGREGISVDPTLSLFGQAAAPAIVFRRNVAGSTNTALVLQDGLLTYVNTAGTKSAEMGNIPGGYGYGIIAYDTTKITISTNGAIGSDADISIDANTKKITSRAGWHQFDVQGASPSYDQWVIRPVSTGSGSTGTFPLKTRAMLYFTGGGANMPQTSIAANLYMDNNGAIWRTSSTRKIKVDEEAKTWGNKGLQLTPKTWLDAFSLGADPKYDVRTPGLVAQDLEEIGLQDFVTYEANGEPQGVMYDRAWITLVEPVARHDKDLLSIRREMDILQAKFDTIMSGK